MERHTRLSRAAVVLVTIALIASIAAAVWFASPDAPYVPSEDSGAALGAAAPAEDGTVANQQTTAPSGYTEIDAATDFNSVRSGGRGTNGSSAKYILMEDITVTSIDTTAWSGSDGNPWKGELDGNGHTIEIDAAKKSGEIGDAGGLFSILGGGAKIYDLTVKITNIGVGSSSSSSFGMIAGTTCGEVTIDNVRVELNKNTNTMTLNSNNEGSSDAYLSASSQLPRKHSRLWLGGVIGKLETSSNVTISDTTVVNNAGGTYGFSVNTWTQGSSWGTNGDSHMYLGGFVGGITSGTLKIANCKYEGEGKLSAVAESASGGRYPRAFVGGALGKNGFKADEEGGTVSVEGFIFEGRANNWENLFYTENINYDDDDTVDNRGLIVGDDCHSNNMTLQGLYVNGQINVGNGNLGESSSSKLIGDNAYWGGMYQYMSPFSDAEFVDGGIAFELSKQNPTDENIVAGFQRVKVVDSATNTTVNTPDENSKVDTLEDVLTSSDPTVWVRATFDKHGSDDYEIRPIYAVKDTYSVENYAAISSYDGSVYTGSKVYDEQILSTPYISVNNTTINAWTAPSGDLTNVGDGSAKVFTYDQSKLSGYTAVEYNGAVYLVNGTTVYSPSEIIVNGEAQTFVLGKNFSYTITPMPVTVTPNVPTTQLYEGGEMPELTVTSTVPADVEGTIAWDEGQTLSAEVTTYYWTWTPASSNYQTMKGSIYLTVFEKEITAIEVTTQPDKLYYVAYEAFDPAGIVVTATYSDGSSAPLSNDEYEFTVMNGDKNRLIVGNDTVTVSLKKGSGASLAVDVPIANQDLVYNGAEQIGVAASVDGYYSLSDNTGTNAAAYTATAELKDKVNTRWDTDTEDDTADKSIAWSIAKENVAITVMHTSKTYDGQVVEPKTLFNAQGVNDEALALTVAVDGGKTILNAGTYSVTASLAESVTNYTAEPVKITYTVNKKGVQKPIDSVPPYTYNGTEQVVTIAENADYTVNGTTKETDAGEYSFTIALADKTNTEWEGGTSDDIEVTWSIIPMTIAGTVSAPTDLTYDGNAKEATFKLTSGKLFNGDAVTIEYSGDNVNVSDGAITATAKLPVSGNYAWADDTAPSATFTISPKAVEIESIQELTKPYDGEPVDPRRLFPAPNGVDGQPIELTVTVDGDKTILGAGTYTVSAKPTSANYAGACEVEYIIQKASPSVTVKVDTDTTYYSSQSLYDIAIEAEEPSVAGNIAWEEGQVLSAATTEYSWVFTPDDVDNYEIVTGKVTLKVENVTLNRIEVTKNPDKMSYVAYSDFDATGMIVTAYFDGADARELGIEELTLSGNTKLQYGNGEATITITFQEKTATVTVNVTKMLIPVPQAQTGIVFDGELHTGIVEDEQWSQYYHVDTELGERYAGTYTAVVNLNDVNNTAWEGTEDSEPKEIPWTIEHVTIEVTVKAESKTVEYGTAYSWDPYDFFAVEVTNSDLFEVELGVFNDGSITDISTANVGEYSESIYATVYNKDGGALGEQDLASFKFSQDITQLAMKVIVTAKTVEVALDENVDFAAYDGAKLSKEELFGMFKTEMNIEDLAFEVDGVPYDEAEIVNAGEYTVKVVSANDNYDLTGTTEGVYKIAKATLTVTASAESDGLDTSDDLYAVPLSVKGVGVNGEEVSGTGVWASGQSLSPGTKNYKFVFTPDQEFAVNYEVCEGECEIANVAQATLTGVSVEIVATREYVAFDAFDRSSIVVEALYGEDRKQVTGYTLTFSIGAEDRLFAGTGITVTVTYTDGEVTQSTEFTIDVAKRAVAKPVVDTTVFDATGETITLPIAESEYYTIYGNTAIEPDRYVATVELKDPANTMWEDGSTDVVSIAWTISEPVTSDEVIADILAMEKVTWQNAEEFLDLEARYNALDESEQTAEATAKLATLKAQYDALRNAAFGDIEAAHEVTAKSLGRALAAAAAGLSAATIALAIAKRRSI